MEKREILLEELNKTISQLFAAYKNMENPEILVYEEWTAKDILGHIVFWHESFARNVHDLVNDIKPMPLKGVVTVTKNLIKSVCGEILIVQLFYDSVARLQDRT
jgi:hypothetical protein